MTPPNPFAPGGSRDTLARVMAPRPQGLLGQPMVVENRQGAGPAVGRAGGAGSPGKGAEEHLPRRLRPQARMSSAIRSAAFSATDSTVALMLHTGMSGKTDASTTRSPSMPRRRRRGSSGAAASPPMRTVQEG